MVETTFVLILLLLIIAVTSQSAGADVCITAWPVRLTSDSDRAVGQPHHAQSQQHEELRCRSFANSATTSPRWTCRTRFHVVGCRRSRLQPMTSCSTASHSRYSARGPSRTEPTFAFRIRRGESVGIVGTSGAGKSTLADVLLGLLEPTAGRVLVDGQNIGGARRSWQRRIGYVAQSFYLLDQNPFG